MRITCISYLFALSTLACLPGPASADEGMWTLDNLPVKKMQSEYSFSPSKEWTHHVMQSSLRIAGGCSASFISKNGLVMTNHHCASSCVEQLSTAQKDYIRNGFLAGKESEELRCPNFEMNRLDNITDVTEQVKAATGKLEGNAYKQAQNAIRAKLTSSCISNDAARTRCDLVDLYQGGRFHLYKYRRFQDARLVWAPEKAAAFLGGDLDNFNFPRYNLDISLLRIYENGKPITVQHFFPLNEHGAKEGELVFVAGHPGRTERQLTVAQLNGVRNINLIQGLIHNAELRGTLTQYMKSSPEAARTAEESLFILENGIKSAQGRLNTLLDPEVMQRKQANESALRQYVASSSELRDSVGKAWDAIAQAEQARAKLNPVYSNFEKHKAFDTRYFEMARDLVRAASERSKANNERLPEYSDARLPEVEEKLFDAAPIYPELEIVNLRFSLEKMREHLGADHALDKLVLGKIAPETLATRLITQSKLADISMRKALWQGGLTAITQSNDPFIKLALAVDPASRQIRARHEKEVESTIQKNTTFIAHARFTRDGLDSYPDATFSLRLSYGSVKGWIDADHPIAPFTNINGAFERDTGSAPFALPASWHLAKNQLNLALPMNFVTDNDITGGNSGSPMFNRKGEIIGLAFDINLPSLGGAYWFDARTNRAVGLHSAMIIEALNKIYRAKHLVTEIKGQ